MIHIIAAKYPDVSLELKKCLRIDGLISVVEKRPVLDIITTDKVLGERDDDYNPDMATYKGNPDVSMSDYIKLKFGDRAVQMINKML